MWKVVQPDKMEDSESGGMDADVATSSIKMAKPISPRIRQYYDGHKGPYKVFIRKVDQELKYFELNKAIRLKLFF